MASGTSSTTALRVGNSGTILLHLDFLVTGIVMTFLGPMLPILAARWHINDAASGRLFLTQFVSSMFGMFLSAPMVQRQGYRLTFMIGLVFMACGVALLGSGPYWLGIIAVGTLGIGHGITTPAGNLRTAEVNPERSASALNVINAVWGVGAMSPAFLISIARHYQRPSWFLYGTSAMVVLLFVLFAVLPFERDSHEEATPSHVAAAGHLAWPMVMLISTLLFVYVGTETAFGQWVATYAHRMQPADKNFWTLMPAFFYGAMLAGRSSAPLALRFVRERSVAKVGLCLAVLGGIALLRAHGVALIVAGSLFAGLGLASIFPISVSLCPAWFGDKARQASGTVFASGNLGGAVLPWLVGVTSTYSGSLRLAFLVPLTGAASMLTFYLMDSSRRTRRVAVPSQP